MTTTEARTRIESAATLADLLDALRETRDLDGEDRDEIDWSMLPTFGGEEPDSTRGVWSWDTESLIVGTCADDIKIVNRATWAEA